MRREAIESGIDVIPTIRKRTIVNDLRIRFLRLVVLVADPFLILLPPVHNLLQGLFLFCFISSPRKLMSWKCRVLDKEHTQIGNLDEDGCWLIEMRADRLYVLA